MKEDLAQSSPVSDMHKSAFSEDHEIIDVRPLLKRCINTNVRRAARAVTRLYDEELAPTGLRSTQLIILIVVHNLKATTVSNLAHELVMDPSTLARNLKPLEKMNLIECNPGEDRRQKLVTLTSRGLYKIIEGTEYVMHAQEMLEEGMSDDELDHLLEGVTHLAHHAQDIHDHRHN